MNNYYSKLIQNSTGIIAIVTIETELVKSLCAYL